MSKLSIGPAGIALNVPADDSHLKQAIELEELGYSTARSSPDRCAG